MDKQESRRQFEEWYGNHEPNHKEGDYYDRQNRDFLFSVWQASRAAIVVDIDWPEANDDHWKDGEEGAYAAGYEVGKDLTAIKVREWLRAAGLSIKGE